MTYQHISLRTALAWAFAACVCSLNPASTFAQTQYYYDNVAGAGFGSAGSTWGTNNVISIDSTGTAAAANTATTTLDTLNLGTSTLGLGAGNISVVASGRSIGSIVRGSASNSGIINIQNNTITFPATGFITNNATGTTLGINSVIAGGGTSMTFTDATIGSSANTYGGVTIINGTHRISSIANGGGNSSLGSSSSAASNLVFNNGAILRFDGTTGTQSTDRNFRMDGSTAIIYVRGDGNLTWNGTASFGTLNQAATLRLQSSNAIDGDGIFAGVLADNGTGQLSLEKFGSSQAAESAWTLSNANTFTGSTTITGGILSLTNANALQNSYINTTASAAGTATTGLRTTGAALNLGGLSGNKDLSDIYTTSTGGYGSVTGITLNVAAANDLDYSGAIDGGRSLTKSGAGTQTLSGANSYTGPTSITAGTLLVNGTHTSGGLYTVGDGTGTDTLGGSGTINANVNIAASGGVLSPGISPGILTINGNVSIAGDLLAELGGVTVGTNYDQLRLQNTGAYNVTLGGTLTPQFSGSGWATPTTQLWIVNNGSTGNLINSFSNYPTNGQLVAIYDSQPWYIYYGANFDTLSTGGGNDVLLTPFVVPEPSSVGMLAFGMIGLWIFRKRK